jgi:Xaa-Pro aminopeptidase
MNKLRVIYSNSEVDSDLYYITRFLAPDPFLFVELNGKRIIFLSDLEYERGKKQASVDCVIRLSPLVDTLKEQKRSTSPTHILLLWLEQNNISKDEVQVEVPQNFPAYLYKEFSVMFPKVIIANTALFFNERIKKSAQEIKYLKEILRITAGAFDIVKKYLQASKIKGRFLYYKGSKLTSEFLKTEVNKYLLANNALSQSIIIAPGSQGCEPHNLGTGPILAHKTLIVDIFPRHLHSRYFGDMTRTFIKGDVSDKIIKLYETVKYAQEEIAIKSIRAGVKCQKIHNSIVEFFTKQGYKTGMQNGKMQGFIHSTGHGLGLDIHEPPRIANNESVLEEGNVVTVEPGLYYFDIGAVRIEDVVVVKKNKAELLSNYPKIFKV